MNAKGNQVPAGSEDVAEVSRSFSLNISPRISTSLASPLAACRLQRRSRGFKGKIAQAGCCEHF